MSSILPSHAPYYQRSIRLHLEVSAYAFSAHKVFRQSEILPLSYTSLSSSREPSTLFVYNQDIWCMLKPCVCLAHALLHSHHLIQSMSCSGCRHCTAPVATLACCSAGALQYQIYCHTLERSPLTVVGVVLVEGNRAQPFVANSSAAARRRHCRGVVGRRTARLSTRNRASSCSSATRRHRRLCR